VHDQYELKPDNIFVIGEGSADMGCVLKHPGRLDSDSRLHAYFGFQRQGAAATEPCAAINDLLRSGHPLGLSSFEKLYPQAEKHPGVIILEHGFETLLGMVANGLIVLKPTPPPAYDSDLVRNAYRRKPTPPRRRAPSHATNLE
jgi:hypothetical protein